MDLPTALTRIAILERRKAPGRETTFQFLEWLAERQETFRAGRRQSRLRAS
jgi:hypothetical protein